MRVGTEPTPLCRGSNRFQGLLHVVRRLVPVGNVGSRARSTRNMAHEAGETDCIGLGWSWGGGKGRQQTDMV